MNDNNKIPELKPLLISKQDIFNIETTYSCGNCGEGVLKSGDNFCSCCGRKVCWKDESSETEGEEGKKGPPGLKCPVCGGRVQRKCDLCGDGIQGKPIECRICNLKFCTKHANNHEHCRRCNGTGTMAPDDPSDLCIRCNGSRLEK